MKAKNFTDAIKKHLQRYGKINQLQALERYGSWKLSARISELRADGWDIETKPKTVKTRYGQKVNVAEYIYSK